MRSARPAPRFHDRRLARQPTSTPGAGCAQSQPPGSGAGRCCSRLRARGG